MLCYILFGMFCVMEFHEYLVVLQLFGMLEFSGIVLENFLEFSGIVLQPQPQSQQQNNEDEHNEESSLDYEDY